MQTPVKFALFALGAFIFLTSAGYTHAGQPEINETGAQPLGMHPGFPRTDPSKVDFSSPVVADLTGDGTIEILTGDSGGCVWGFTPGGDLLPNFPFKPGGSCSSGKRINSPLAVGNLDGDSDLEIVAGTMGDGEEQGHRGKVYAWNPDGSSLSGWPKEMDWNMQYGHGNPEVYTVAIANVAGGSELEIIAGTSNNSSEGKNEEELSHNTYAWYSNGSMVSGYPVMWLKAGIYGQIAAGDVNNDGCEEILVGRDHRWLHLYNASGQDLLGWPQETFVNPEDRGGPYLEFTRNAPALGDIDGDGSIEIVAPGRVKNDGVVLNSALLVFKTNGNRLGGWGTAKLGDGFPVNDSDDPSMAPALADLDQDGTLEIIVGLTDGSMRAYKSNGDLIWKYEVGTERLYFSEPVVGDINDDGNLDIVFGAYSPDGSANQKAGIYALSKTGSLMNGYPLALTSEGGDNNGVRAAPTLADADGDSKVEIIAASRGGAVYMWDLDSTYNPDLMPWPTGRHNNHRNAFADPSPYRAVQQEISVTLIEGAQTTFLPYVETSAGVDTIKASCQ